MLRRTTVLVLAAVGAMAFPAAGQSGGGVGSGGEGGALQDRYDYWGNSREGEERYDYWDEDRWGRDGYDYWNDQNPPVGPGRVRAEEMVGDAEGFAEDAGRGWWPYAARGDDPRYYRQNRGPWYSDPWNERAWYNRAFFDYDLSWQENEDWDTYDYSPQYFEEYGPQRAPERSIDYRFDRTVSGRVRGVERFRGAYGSPEAVVVQVETDDGRTWRLRLGDPDYVVEHLPAIEPGEAIKIRGRERTVAGRRVFEAREVRHRGRTFSIPDYAFNRTVRGRLTGVRSVVSEAGEPEALVGLVETRGGDRLRVLLGRVEELKGEGARLRVGEPVEVRGYVRTVGGRSTFVVQEVERSGGGGIDVRGREGEAEARGR